MFARPDYHYLRLCLLDPEVSFHEHRGLPRRTEGVLHRLLLGVAFTKESFYRI